MIRALNFEESPVSRMLGLIERRAPVLLRIGGAPLSRECRITLTPAQRAKIVALARGGELSGTDIARAIGTRQSTVQKILRQEGIQTPDGRKTRGRKPHA